MTDGGDGVLHARVGRWVAARVSRRPNAAADMALAERELAALCVAGAPLEQKNGDGLTPLLQARTPRVPLFETGPRPLETCRGDAAAATWLVRGDHIAATWIFRGEKIAETPRLRRG